MTYLIAAIAALAAGPLLDAGAGRRRALVPVLDGLVMAAIPGLIFLEFVPAAVGEGRWGVLGALLLGFVLPVVAERTARRAGEQTHRWALLAGLTGFMIHSGLDGAALATLPPGGPVTLALAAVLQDALDSPEARARIGQAGRQRVVNQWSWRHTAERTVEQYRAVLEESAR